MSAWIFKHRQIEKDTMYTEKDISQLTEDAQKPGLSQVSGCREEDSPAPLSLYFPPPNLPTHRAQGLRASEGDPPDTVPSWEEPAPHQALPSPHTSLWHMVCTTHPSAAIA